jgi:hypothetical protein
VRRKALSLLPRACWYPYYLPEIHDVTRCLWSTCWPVPELTLIAHSVGRTVNQNVQKPYPSDVCMPADQAGPDRPPGMLSFAHSLPGCGCGLCRWFAQAAFEQLDDVVIGQVARRRAETDHIRRRIKNPILITVRTVQASPNQRPSRHFDPLGPVAVLRDFQNPRFRNAL